MLLRRLGTIFHREICKSSRIIPVSRHFSAAQVVFNSDLHFTIHYLFSILPGSAKCRCCQHEAPLGYEGLLVGSNGFCDATPRNEYVEVISSGTLSLKSSHSNAIPLPRIPFIREGLINTGRIEKENINTPHVLKGVEILDIGCGGGILTEVMIRTAY